MVYSRSLNRCAAARFRLCCLHDSGAGGAAAATVIMIDAPRSRPHHKRSLMYRVLFLNSWGGENGKAVSFARTCSGATLQSMALGTTRRHPFGSGRVISPHTAADLLTCLPASPPSPPSSTCLHSLTDATCSFLPPRHAVRWRPNAARLIIRLQVRRRRDARKVALARKTMSLARLSKVWLWCSPRRSDQSGSNPRTRASTAVQHVAAGRRAWLPQDRRTSDRRTRASTWRSTGRALQLAARVALAA